MKSTIRRIMPVLALVTVGVQQAATQEKEKEKTSAIEAAIKELEQLRLEYERRIRLLEEQLEKLRAPPASPTNAPSGKSPVEGPTASTNTTAQPPPPGQAFQQATESRERALMQLRNRFLRERIEHVLREFVDFSGYFRGGFGRSDKGTPQVPFQAPGAPAKYRLGNETENYGELALGKDWYVADLFKFDSAGVTNEPSRGPIARMQLRVAFLDPYSNYGSPDTFQSTLPEVWASAGNFWEAQPSLKFWAGNRYYRRHDIHMNDFYFLDMSGGGGGFEDLQLPFGKLAGAWIGDGAQSGIFRDPLHSDPNNKAGFSKQNVNVSLYDMPAPWGKAEIGLAYSNETGGQDASGMSAPDSDGVALSFIHTHERFVDENGFNKLSLQVGYGAAKSFTSGFETFNTTNGTFILPDEPDSWRFRLTEQLVVQPTEHFSLGAAMVFQYTDYRSALGDRYWVSGGVRPIFHFTKYLNLAFEGGVDYVNDSALGTSGSLYKLTVAPQVSLGNLFFSRPVIRAYVTYAGWGDEFRGRVAGSDYAERNYGWGFGMQMEAWW